MTGYAKRYPGGVPQWPGGAALSKADYDAWETAIYELKYLTYNVKDFAAVGNGTTDDTTAFQAAISAASGAGGGIVYIPPGKYRITDTLEPKSAILQGAAGTPLVPSDEVTVLFHDFNGDFIRWPSSANNGAWGGGIRDLLLMNKAGKTGTAIKGLANSGDAVGPSRIFIANVYVSTLDGTSQGFTRDVDIDGSLATIGCRQWFFNNCQFFGAETAGETVRLNNCRAFHFSDCSIWDAPSLLRSGLKIVDTASAAIFWIGGTVTDISTAAANSTGSPGVGLMFVGAVNGNVVCDAAAKNNTFYLGYLNGTMDTGGSNAAVYPNNLGGRIVQTSFASPVTVSGASEAAATTVVTAPAITFDGTTQIAIEFVAPAVTTAANDVCIFYLYDGSTSLGLIGYVNPASASTPSMPVCLKRSLIPSAGAHTYSIRASRTTSNATIQAGNGTAGNYGASYMQISR